MIKVLFVCMGNICRSPTAEGVFRHLAEKNKLIDRLHIDSAGTHAYHIGEPPDGRSLATANNRNIDMGQLRARKVDADDFDKFDHILAMDADNLAALMQTCPGHLHYKIELFMNYADNFEETEVPDPYYGGASGFDHVFDLVEDAASGLLKKIQTENR
ncbi:MAG: low molecular weight phosphotyrosine protein phosphatase [Gammaproteobacteria bacterium]|nr:low molecular weight phosphotyrosine protein phosphatase [Gammaproteobacteria bacterium]